MISEYAVSYGLSELLEAAVWSYPNLHELNLKEVTFTSKKAKELCLIAPRLSVLTLGTSEGTIESE